MKDKKVVLVTGASSGIGKAVAKKFLEKGHIVYGVARRENLMKNLEKQGGKVFFMDVQKDDSVKKCVARIIKEQGRVDVLVNNAGYAQYGSVEDVSIERAKAQLDTNVYGYVRTIKEVLPVMRKNNSGIIINVTSALGKFAIPYAGWYCAGKFALEGLSDSLRNEVRDFGVDVVVVEPGFTKTNIYNVAWKFLDKVKIHSVYKKRIKSFKNNFKKREKKAPGPEVIAKIIYKAGMSKSPKTRYAVPMESKGFIFLKWLLPDRIADWFVNRGLK